MVKQVTLEDYLLYSQSTAYHVKVSHDLLNKEIRFTMTPEDSSDPTLIFTVESNRVWATIDNSFGLGI